MNPIKQKKDELFIEKLELINEYIFQKHQLETMIKSGCLHLAKARYVDRRPNCISTLQLPTSDSTNDVHPIYNVTLVDSNAKENVPAEDKENCENELNKTNVNKGVTKSQNENNKTQDDPKVCSNDECFELLTNDPGKNNNPLKWFGVLVSQSLRYAQIDFQRCVELSVDIANIQLKLHKLGYKIKASATI